MREFNQVRDSNTNRPAWADCAPITGGREAKPNRRLSLRVTMPLLGLLIVTGLRFSMQETIANWYTCCSSGYYCWLCPYTGDDWPADGGGDGSSSSGWFGMPVWSVTEPSLNLWLNDTPLFYNPSRGGGLSFLLLYKNEIDFFANID